MPVYEWKARAYLPWSQVRGELRVAALTFRPSRRTGEEGSLAQVEVEVETDAFTSDDRSRPAAVARGLRDLQASLQLWSLLTGRRWELVGADAEILRVDDGGAPTCAIEATASLLADAIAVQQVRQSTLAQLALAMELEGRLPSSQYAKPLGRTLDWTYRSLAEKDPVNRFAAAWIALNIVYDALSPGTATGERAKIDTLAGSISDPERVLTACSGAMAVIHACPTDFRRSSGEDDGSELQIALSAGHHGEALRRFLQCSYTARCSLFHEGRWTDKVLWALSTALVGVLREALVQMLK
jgi:hypothetical protein